ncbi:MAG: hypothetical protein RBQ97_05765, partial [Acholeplasma sp.]|nr:hypothetical protein [Acholeplasma sp.]
TVLPYNKYRNTGTGFSFFEENSNVFKDKVIEAIDLYTNQYQRWGQMIRRAMKNDFGLEKMALNYSQLYQWIVEG